MAEDERQRESSGDDGHIPRPSEILAGKYRIEATLGAGAMGVVLAGRHLTLDKPVAIKVLRPSAASRPVIVQRFLREARAALSIQSAHVVRIMDVGTLENGAPFMVMERLDGQDLAQMLEARGPLPVGETVSYVMQACDAIAEAHERGIVHRDLKPANLFVTRRVDGRPLVKVLDFGISKAPTDGSVSDLSLTESAAMLGSPTYMSPEQVRDSKSVDARADIWALGVVLYKLLTGKAPFEGSTFSSLCAAIVADPPAPLAERLPTVPAGLEACIFRCLEKDPAARFANVAALVATLGPFAEATAQAERLDDTLVEATATAAATASTWDTSSAERRRLPPGRWGLFALGLGTTGLVALAAFELRDRSSPAGPPTSSSHSALPAGVPASVVASASASVPAVSAAASATAPLASGPKPAARPPPVVTKPPLTLSAAVGATTTPTPAPSPALPASKPASSTLEVPW